MFCRKCGKEIDENVKFCPYCGTAAEDSESHVLENDNSEISTDDLMGNKKATDKKNKVKRPFYKKKRYWILGVFLIWFIWAWFNVDIDDSETKIPNSENISEEEVVEDKKSAEEDQREKEEKAAEQETALRAEYIFPDSDKKYLSEDEVRSITADKLYIGRNEVFARHGYIFQDANLKEHFESTSWYQGTVTGDQFNADAVFNDFEKKNVELIKRIEDEINKPAKEPFVGMSGVYISKNSLWDGMTGKIEIQNVGEDSFDFSIGALELSYSAVSGRASIIDAYTAQATVDGLTTFTFTWSDSENMYAVNSGIAGDWTDASLIDIATDGQSYIRPLEFNQW